MAHNGWDEQNDDHRRQQPNWPDDEMAWQRQINCADRQKRQHRLNARLRFVDVLWSVAHYRPIATFYQPRELSLVSKRGLLASLHPPHYTSRMRKGALSRCAKS